MKESRIGKFVNDVAYFHLTSVDLVQSDLGLLAKRAVAVAGDMARAANVVKVDIKKQAVSLLHYPAFFEQAFPQLTQSWRIFLDTDRVSYRTYAESLNPPILHRKELLLAPHHPVQREWQSLTAQAESLGLFEDPSSIGFLNHWEALVRSKGYRVEGHTLQPLGNEIFANEPLNVPIPHFSVQRHLTALVRSNFSAPVQMLARHGFIDPRYTFFDYGCGRGNDLASVVQNGIEAAGWDPYYAPESPVREADVVNLGFVINVIENVEERIAALKRAFSLTRKVLAVSVMLHSNYSNNGQAYSDGYLTSKRTFQKYFSQEEIKEFLGAVLEAEAIPVAPGIMFVFADSNIEQQFLTQRFCSRGMMKRLQNVKRVPTPKTPRVSRSDELFQINKPLLDELWALCLDLGRKPEKSEIPFLSQLQACFTSMSQAMHLLDTHYDQEQLAKAAITRKADLLVFFALQYFDKRKPYRHHHPRLRQDIKHFFNDYQSALDEGRDLLLQAASPVHIDAACASAFEQGLGWYEPSHSLQLHTTMVERLPTILRIYVGCALKLYGDIDESDLVKLHIRSGKLTLMSFDDFEGKALPKMTRRVKLDLRSQDFQVFDYVGEFPPPYAYFKSRFINEEFIHFPEQLAVEEFLESQGLLTFDGHGPSVDKFDALLRQKRYAIDGFTISRIQTIPELDEPCGRYLTYRHLIECGETQHRTQLPNLPKAPETYTALLDLAQEVLDPIIEFFGMIKLTYGFSSPALSSMIPGRIAPALDQHAAHERKRNGDYVCVRLGAACDFLIEDENMAEVADWIMNTIPFDRLYFYGEDKPIHISYTPTPALLAYEMCETKAGTRVPKKLSGRSAHRRTGTEAP